MLDLRYMLFAICSSLHALRYMHFAILMHFAICSSLYALRYMLFAICSSLYALCYMLFAICSLLYALRYMVFAIWSLLYALRYMFFAICSSLYALRYMLFAICSSIMIFTVPFSMTAHSNVFFCFSLLPGPGPPKNIITHQGSLVLTFTQLIDTFFYLFRILAVS
jgi:hypothetical protein